METQFDFKQCWTCESLIYDLDKGYICTKTNQQFVKLLFSVPITIPAIPPQAEPVLTKIASLYRFSKYCEREKEEWLLTTLLHLPIKFSFPFFVHLVENIEQTILNLKIFNNRIARCRTNKTKILCTRFHI